MSVGSAIRKWWPAILLGLAFSTWAATEFIDDRIDSKLGAVMERLVNIEKVLIRIEQKQEHIEKALSK